MSALNECPRLSCVCNLQYQNNSQSEDRQEKTENSSFQKGLGAITSSLNYIGNAFEVSLSEILRSL